MSHSIPFDHGRPVTQWVEWLGRKDVAGTVMAVAMAFVARLAVGYESFPNVDDFVYVPQARAYFDEALYPTDLFVQESILHTPVLAILIRLFEATVGIAGGLLIATICLSVATILGIQRLLRGIGAEGVLLPLAVLIVACGLLSGLGRGQYGGIFGDTFHMQWLALCLLLWTYERFVAGRAIVAGILLGLTAVMHPIVGAHGAAVLFVATLVSPPGRWRRLAIMAAVSLLVSSPAIGPLALRVLQGETVSGFDPVTYGYLFRTPQEFVLRPMPVALFIAVAGLGWAGAVLMFRRAGEPGIRCFVGLLLGQSVLAGLAIAAHGEWMAGSWIEEVSLVYRVVLTRTTPLLLVLSTVAFAAAAERFLRRGDRTERSRPARVVFRALAGVTLTLVLVQINWHPVLLVALLLMAATVFIWRDNSTVRAAAVGLWAMLGLAGLGIHASQVQVEAVVPPQEEELFRWVRENTAPEALFIVSPGFQAFRLYTERGAYVDFKTFPASTLPLIQEWYRRLEQVAAPDKLARDARGWTEIAEWDRTYANRNTPRRIADLLAETGSDYFIWSADGLAVPPYALVERTQDQRLAVAFSNPAFTVYRLKEAGDAQGD